MSAYRVGRPEVCLPPRAPLWRVLWHWRTLLRLRDRAWRRRWGIVRFAPLAERLTPRIVEELRAAGWRVAIETTGTRPPPKDVPPPSPPTKVSR